MFLGIFQVKAKHTKKKNSIPFYKLIVYDCKKLALPLNIF